MMQIVVVFLDVFLVLEIHKNRILRLFVTF